MAAKPSAKSVKNVAAKKAGASLTGLKAAAAPLSGQAIAAGHPNWYGSKTAAPGASFHQTGAAASPTNASGTLTTKTKTTTKPAAPAAPSAPPPFLTPAEQAAWMKYQGSYQDRIGNINPDSLAGASPDQITQALINGGGTLGQSLSQGQSRFTQGMGNAQQAHDMATDNANQVMAARGLFQSSIRDGDLNDIDATLATRQATLNTAWSSLQTRIGTQYDMAVRDMGTTSSYYSGLGVQNAQAADTGIPSSTGATGAAAAGATTAGAGGPAPTGPATPQGVTTGAPTPAGPATPQGVTKSPGIPKPPAAPKIGAGIPKVTNGFGYRGGF